MLLRFKVFIELIVISLLAQNFIIEVMKALEYMQGTRLALINMKPEIGAILVLMSVTRRKFSYILRPFVRLLKSLIRPRLEPKTF